MPKWTHPSLFPHTQTFASAEFLKPLCFIYPTPAPTPNHTDEGWLSAFSEKYGLLCKSTACQLLGVMIHTPMIDIFFPGGCSLWVSDSTMLVFTDSDEKNRCQDEDWKGDGGGLRGCRMTRMERELSPENSETFFLSRWALKLLPASGRDQLGDPLPFQEIDYSCIFIDLKKIDFSLSLWVFADVINPIVMLRSLGSCN